MSYIIRLVLHKFVITLHGLKFAKYPLGI